MFLNLAKFFLIFGIVFFVFAVIFYLLSRIGLNVKDFPGNIRIEASNFTCVLALGASILLSIILTGLLNVIVRLFNK